VYKVPLIDTKFKMDIILKKDMVNHLFEYFGVAQNSVCIHVRLRTFIVQLWAANHPHFICVAFLIQDVRLVIADSITSLYMMEEMPLPNSRNQVMTPYLAYLVQRRLCDLIQDTKK
jgi:hypothetical protein